MPTHFSLTTILRTEFPGLHFREEGKEWKGEELTCPRPHSCLWMWPRLCPGFCETYMLLISAIICLAYLEQLLRWNRFSFKISNVSMGQMYWFWSWDECFLNDVWVVVSVNIHGDILTAVGELILKTTLKCWGFERILTPLYPFPYSPFLSFSLLPSQ